MKRFIRLFFVIFILTGFFLTSCVTVVNVRPKRRGRRKKIIIVKPRGPRRPKKIIIH